MKSRITIEVDFNNNNQPVIEVYLVDTEDVRDRLLRAFFEKLQHASDLCKVEFVANHVENGVTTFQRIHISPIPPPKKNASQFNFRPINRQDLMSDAEKAITNAIYEVEKVGASEALTFAVIKLGEAKEAVRSHYKLTS